MFVTAPVHNDVRTNTLTVECLGVTPIPIVFYVNVVAWKEALHVHSNATADCDFMNLVLKQNLVV